MSLKLFCETSHIGFGMINGVVSLVRHIACLNEEIGEA